MTTYSKYVELASVNVGDKIEKKGDLSYLSWAWAVDQLLRHDPAAAWTYGEPQKWGNDTMMVSCTVTAFGVPRTMEGMASGCWVTSWMSMVESPVGGEVKGG